MYCVNKCGSKKKDYSKGFASLHQVVKELKFDLEHSNYLFSAIDELLTSIEKILKKRALDDNGIQQIGNLLFEFESEKEKQFRERYLEARLARAAKLYYPQQLFNTVEELFTAESNDAIVAESFKYIDKHLQQILQLSPHESYGEDLINRAFAPNSGAIQLNTHINEQTGLRNFFSGANALFRNPSAHRSLFRGEHALFPNDADAFASAIVAMVSMMSKITTTLYARKLSSDITNILSVLASKRGWDQSLYIGTTVWCVGTVAESPSRKLSDYRIQVFIEDKKSTVHLLLKVHKDVSERDRKQLKKSLYQLSGLRVTTMEVAP